MGLVLMTGESLKPRAKSDDLDCLYCGHPWEFHDEFGCRAVIARGENARLFQAPEVAMIVCRCNRRAPEATLPRCAHGRPLRDHSGAVLTCPEGCVLAQER